MDRDLVEMVCRRYCSYYKPEKGGKERGCRGAVILEGLLRKGREIPFEPPGACAEVYGEEAVSSALCIDCAYYGEDCDFAAKKEGALPCGGFLFISLLLNGRFIRVDEVREAV